jgi:hypothetical protein
LVCKVKAETGGRGQEDEGRPGAMTPTGVFLRSWEGQADWDRAGAGSRKRVSNPRRARRRPAAGQAGFERQMVCTGALRVKIYQAYRRAFEITSSEFSFFAAREGRWWGGESAAIRTPAGKSLDNFAEIY